MLNSGSACGVPAKALPMIVVTTSNALLSISSTPSSAFSEKDGSMVDAAQLLHSMDGGERSRLLLVRRSRLLASANVHETHLGTIWSQLACFTKGTRAIDKRITKFTMTVGIC